MFVGATMGINALPMDASIEVRPNDDRSGERELVARAKANCLDFAPLYSRYAQRVYWYAFHCLGDREAAEDATSPDL